jgi:hypothetical protein
MTIEILMVITTYRLFMLCGTENPILGHKLGKCSTIEVHPQPFLLPLLEGKMISIDMVIEVHLIKDQRRNYNKTDFKRMK